MTTLKLVPKPPLDSELPVFRHSGHCLVGFVVSVQPYRVLIPSELSWDKELPTTSEGTPEAPGF